MEYVTIIRHRQFTKEEPIILLKYALYCYNLIDDEKPCFEHEDKSKVIAEALRLSSSDNGRFTYRMQMELDGEFLGGMRFFQDGKESTSDFVAELMSGILGESYIKGKG
jgi:hypothetical protein